jgi:hypothetical protein
MKSQFEFTLKMYSPHLANRFTMRLSVLRFVVENKCSCFTAKPVLMPISYTVLFSDSFRHSLNIKFSKYNFESLRGFLKFPALVQVCSWGVFEQNQLCVRAWVVLSRAIEKLLKEQLPDSFQQGRPL